MNFVMVGVLFLFVGSLIETVGGDFRKVFYSTSPVHVTCLRYLIFVLATLTSDVVSWTSDHQSPKAKAGIAEPDGVRASRPLLHQTILMQSKYVRR